MTIIVFLIDTSASMNQRAYLGGRPTLLDVAKSAVETFVKVRQRSPESRGDRYMLLTFEDTPHNIKAGWKENLATFMNELKNLQCIGLTTLGAALKNAFDVLNINRMQTGIDTYGQGRCPYYLEPSVIVVITDGGKYTTVNGVHQDFTLPMHTPIPGSELTKEPFRWDQRLFSLVLRLSGTPVADRDTGLVPSDASPIDAMCEVTGGRSYCITSHRMMMQCIDSLVQKVQSGVVINFEKIGPDPPPLSGENTPVISVDGETIGDDSAVVITNGSKNGTYPPGTGPNQTLVTPANNTAWHSCRKLIYVPRSAQKGFAVGFWPIPESFWPDLSASALPPRSAHPVVKFTCTSQEPLVIENLPFDKYELEPSPLTQYILARKQPTVCWQVFVANSYRASEVGHPFGYLKASTNLTCVNLFVMPYNYPVLLPLLDELFKVHRQKPSNDWRTQFQSYLRTMPTYYAAPLRRALTRMGAPAALAQTLIPDNMDNSLSYNVLNYLKRLKTQAKNEFERLCGEVISRQVASKSLANGNANAVLEGVKVTARTTLKKDLVSHPVSDLRDELSKFSDFVVGLVRNQQQQRGAQSYRNAFDIPRKTLLDQVVRMRSNFLQPSLIYTKLLDDDYIHSMPVSQMGNYQEYLKRMTPPLREIESTPVRQHMFGNPFKIDKRMMVDEADIDIVGSTSSTSRGLKRSLSMSDIPNGTAVTPRINGPNKKKPGPIPKDFQVPKALANRRNSVSPAHSPPSSPTPWNNNDNKSNQEKSGHVVGNSGVLLNISHNFASPLPNAALSTGVASIVPQETANTNLSGTTSVNSVNSEKLVNGLGEVPMSPSTNIGIFHDFKSADYLHNHLNYSSSLPSKVQTVNNIYQLNKDITGKGERTDNIFKIDHSNRLASSSSSVSGSNSSCTLVNYSSSADSKHNFNSAVKVKVSNEKVLTNHVEEKQEQKIDKSKTLNAKELEDVRRNNLTVRSSVYREIRKKGRNYSALFSHLQNIQGTLDIRLKFVQDVIRETLRFKRRELASLLEDYLKKLREDNTVIHHSSRMSYNGATKIT